MERRRVAGKYAWHIEGVCHYLILFRKLNLMIAYAYKHGDSVRNAP